MAESGPSRESDHTELIGSDRADGRTERTGTKSHRRTAFQRASWFRAPPTPRQMTEDAIYKRLYGARTRPPAQVRASTREAPDGF